MRTKAQKKPGPVPRRPASTLTSDYEKLNACIQKGWNTDEEISDPKIFMALEKLLKAQRESSTTLELKFVVQLVRVLENDEEHICGRLDPLLFSVIINTILQSDYCRESERGLYLLADSLHHEGRGDQRVKERKKLIGSNSLRLLLERLVDTSGNPALRRWIGILCIQLLQHASSNIDILGYGSDNVRQSIGRLITEDENEIIKYICGKLVQALQRENIELRSLWPKETSRVVFDEFPSSTQEDVSWSQQFQTYLDTVYETQVSQHRRSGVLLYFASKCELDTFGIIGTSSHVKNMLITEDRITIHVPGSEECLDTILDIPRTAISVLKITATQDSQIQGNAEAIFEIKEGTDDYCFLNGEAVLLGRICVLMPMDMIQNLRDDFPGAYKEIEVLDKEIPFLLREVVNLQGAIMTGSDDDGYYPDVEADELDNSGGARPVHSQGAFITGDDNEPYGLNDARQDSYTSSVDAIQYIYQSPNVVSVGSDEEKPAKIPKPSKSSHDSTTGVPSQLAAPGDQSLNEVNLVEPKLPISKYAVRRKAKKPIQVSQDRQNPSVPAQQEKANKPKRVVARLPAPTAPSRRMRTHLETSSPFSDIDKHDSSTIKVGRGLKASEEVENMGLKKLQESNSKLLNHNSQALMAPQGAAGKTEISAKAIIYPPKPATDNTFEIEPDDEGVVPLKAKKNGPKRIAKKPITYSGSVKETKVKTSKKKAGSEKRQSAPSRLENLKEPQGRPTRMNPPRKTQMGKENTQAEAQGPAIDPLEGTPHKHLARKSQGKKVAEEAKSISVPKTVTIALGRVGSDNGQDPPAVEGVATGDRSFNHEGSLPRLEFQQNQHHEKHSGLAGDQAPQTEPKIDKQQVVAEPSSKIQGKNMLRKSLSHFPDGNIDTEIENQDLDELVIEPEVVLPNVITIAAKAVTKHAVLHHTGSKTRQNMSKEISLLANKIEIPQLSKAQYEPQTIKDLENPIPGSGQSGSSLKRKSDVSESASPKRRRLDQSDIKDHLPLQNPSTEGNSDVVLRHSIRTVEEGIEVGTEQAQTPSRVFTPETGPTKASAAAKTPLPSLPEGFSPQIAEREQNPGKVPEVSLVDETVYRKITLIEFNRNGPRNQGRSTTQRQTVTRNSGNRTTAQALPSKRRKMDIMEDTEVLGLPKKRQHSSPIIRDHEDEYFADAQKAVISSLEKSDSFEPVAPRVSHHRVKSMTSSQNSRVTAKGSPMALPRVSILGYNFKAEQKLRDVNAPTEEVEELKTQGCGKSYSDLFGGKVILSSRLKTQPSSLDKMDTRYVRHHKTNSGQFEHAQTKEVIPVQAVLPDPFVEKTRTPSIFAERLRRNRTDIGSKARGPAHVPHVAGQKVVKSMVSGAPKKILRAPIEDLERTLVEEDSVSLMPALSSPSSQGQHREHSRSPMKEISPNGRWTMALRPHYTNLHDAVHRVADDMLVRLSQEENSMSLIVAQYQDNGTMILSNVVKERNKERARMVGGLIKKRNCLLAAYGESKKVIKKTTEPSRDSSITSYEKEWKTKQLSIREKIAEGRRALD